MEQERNIYKSGARKEHFSELRKKGIFLRVEKERNISQSGVRKEYLSEWSKKGIFLRVEKERTVFRVEQERNNYFIVPRKEQERIFIRL